MKFKIKDCMINVEWAFIILIITSILSKKFRNYMEMYYVCFLFIIFHEMAHVFIGRIFQKKIRNINISVCGLSILFSSYVEKESKEFLKNIVDGLTYLAGPMASYIIANIFKDIKFVYEINMAFFILNLIPIYPLDGYMITKTILKIFKNQKMRTILLKTITISFLCVFLILMVFFIIKYKNYNCVIFMLYILTLNIAK